MWYCKVLINHKRKTSRWHGSSTMEHGSSHYVLWSFHKETSQPQATWIVYISTLSPYSGTLFCISNGKLHSSENWDSGPQRNTALPIFSLAPVKHLLFSLVHKWLHTRNLRVQVCVMALLKTSGPHLLNPPLKLMNGLCLTILSKDCLKGCCYPFRLFSTTFFFHITFHQYAFIDHTLNEPL